MPHVWINKLMHYGTLAGEEQRVILGILGPSREVARNTDIVSEGDPPSHSTVILEGLTARYNLVENGGRQITQAQIADAAGLSLVHVGCCRICASASCWQRNSRSGSSICLS